MLKFMFSKKAIKIILHITSSKGCLSLFHHSIDMRTDMFFLHEMDKLTSVLMSIEWWNKERQPLVILLREGFSFYYCQNLRGGLFPCSHSFRRSCQVSKWANKSSTDWLNWLILGDGTSLLIHASLALLRINNAERATRVSLWVIEYSQGYRDM